jgi:hypothetical protein
MFRLEHHSAADPRRAVVWGKLAPECAKHEQKRENCPPHIGPIDSKGRTVGSKASLEAIQGVAEAQFKLVPAFSQRCQFIQTIEAVTHQLRLISDVGDVKEYAFGQAGRQ